MNNSSRTRNSIINTFFGIGSQIITVLLAFACRTFFIRLLGAEYLGINGLYTNVLTVLSLADLGFSSVLIYSLYKPIVNNDYEKITSLLHYFKKLYRFVALAVLVIGLTLIPIMQYIIKSSLPYDKLIIYYGLFLLNSIVSYFAVYKSALMNADQKIYIIKIINTIFVIAQYILQILVLLVVRNYIAYLVVQISCTIFNNIIISRSANKLYPYLKKKTDIGFISDEIVVIRNNVKSMFLYKMGTVIMSSTDNILISAILGTVVVGYYSNYSMIVNMVNTFFGIFIAAIFSSVGNLNAQGNQEKSYLFFSKLVLFIHWLAAFCSSCFLLVFNDFVTIWAGKNYVLDLLTVISIIICFYTNCLSSQNWMYRETNGLFKEIKYTLLLAALINIILSITFGNLIGLPGILISTAIARLSTIFWYEPYILYRKIFIKPFSDYWIKQSKYFFITCLSVLIGYFVTYSFPVSVLFILLKITISFVIVTTMFFIINIKNPDIEFLVSYLHRLTKRARS